MGYVRRSKELGLRTVSLEDQHERIAAYCQERDRQLAEVVADDGVSGVGGLLASLFCRDYNGAQLP